MECRPTHSRRLGCALAILLLAAAPAAAQTYDPDRFREQTPEEIAATAALNRVQIERGQEAAARQAQREAEAAERLNAYQRELDHNQQLWFEYEMQAQAQARMEEDYRRTLEEQARIEAACRRGNRAVCDRAWLERGLQPPAPPSQPGPARPPGR